MNIRSTRLYLQRFLLYVGVACGILGVINSDTVYSQTNSRIFIRVTEPAGTYFKRRVNWFRQSPQITSNLQRCRAELNDEFTISSYRNPVGLQPIRERNKNSIYFGNIEYPQDYWEVTLQNTSGCRNQENASTGPWFVYKNHVQILQAPQ